MSRKIEFNTSESCLPALNKSNTNYKPISCDDYDWLEIWSMKKRTVLIEYSSDGKQLKVEAIIKTLKTENGIEFLITEAGLEIRLDHLLSITEMN